MKKLAALVMAIALMCTFVMAASAKTSVKGYYKSNGTYVQPHYRTSTNTSFYDNWSTKGNYNPYTGQKGYKTYRYGW